MFATKRYGAIRLHLKLKLVLNPPDLLWRFVITFLDYRFNLLFLQLGWKLMERTSAFKTRFRSTLYNHNSSLNKIYRKEKKSKQISDKYPNDKGQISCVANKVTSKKNCHGGCLRGFVFQFAMGITLFLLTFDSVNWIYKSHNEKDEHCIIIQMYRSI